MFWGSSPALDLLSNYKLINTLEGKTELNILVAASSDARHVLMTISKYYTHEDAQNLTINFYVVDLLIEFIARELLLILIALEPSSKIGLKEKANLWMEIFGNIMLRSTTAEYVKKKAYQYMKIITSKAYQLQRMPCFNLENLKYVEKDRLENIFKFWFKNEINMAVSWDKKVRKSLGRRYDARFGVFDWDYYMVLKDIKEADRINPREYKQWRNTGIAFTWLEKEFAISNATLAVGIVADGDKLISLEYLGDVSNGPYFCFGLDCEDEDMLKCVNRVRAQRATDLTERNVMRMFYEIENNSKYVHTGDSGRELGTVVTQMVKLNFEDTELSMDSTNVEEEYSPLSIKHNIIFLPTNTLQNAAKLEKYNRFFDLIHLGNTLISMLNESILSMAKDGGLILMETRKFLLLKEESKQEFENAVKQVMQQNDCEAIGKQNFIEDNFVTFQMKMKKLTSEQITEDSVIEEQITQDRVSEEQIIEAQITEEPVIEEMTV